MHLIQVVPTEDTKEIISFFRKIQRNIGVVIDVHYGSVSETQFKKDAWNLIVTFPWIMYVQHDRLASDLDPSIIYTPVSVYGKEIMDCFLYYGTFIGDNRPHQTHEGIFLGDLCKDQRLSDHLQITQQGFVYGEITPCCLLIRYKTISWSPARQYDALLSIPNYAIDRFWRVFPHVFIICSEQRRSYIQNVVKSHSLDRHIKYIPAVIPPQDSNDHLSKGQWGCFLSHMEVFRQCHKFFPHEPVMILEDDVMVSPNLFSTWVGDYLVHFFRCLPSDWDMVYLGSCWDECRHHLPAKNGTYKQIFSPLCSHAYIIRARWGALFFSSSMACNLPFDHFLRKKMKRYKLRIYAPLFIDPFVQNPHLQSVIQNPLDQFIRQHLTLAPCVEHYWNISNFCLIILFIIACLLVIHCLVFLITRSNNLRVSVPKKIYPL